MNLVICHIDKGGSYRVSKFYAEVINAKLMIKPSIIDVIKILMDNSVDAVFFHNISLAFKFSFLFICFNRKVKIFCVEHFVMSQILREEIVEKRKRFFLFFRLRINRLLGVKVICLDSYSKRNREKFIREDVEVVYNPLLGQVSEAKVSRPYDIVWSGGLSDQKKWPDVLSVLISLSAKGIRVAIASYDEPSVNEKEIMKSSNIDFFLNYVSWTSLSNNYFFSSNFEGYPLVLIEAIEAKMNIIAWCNKACDYQVLREWGRYKFFTSKSDIDSDQEGFLTFEYSSKDNRDYILNRHDKVIVSRKIISLLDG